MLCVCIILCYLADFDPLSSCICNHCLANAIEAAYFQGDPQDWNRWYCLPQSSKRLGLGSSYFEGDNKSWIRGPTTIWQSCQKVLVAKKVSRNDTYLAPHLANKYVFTYSESLTFVEVTTQFVLGSWLSSFTQVEASSLLESTTWKVKKYLAPMSITWLTEKVSWLWLEWKLVLSWRSSWSLVLGWEEM